MSFPLAEGVPMLKFMYAVVLIIFAQACGGCFYIHDDARQKLADDANKTFADITASAGYESFISEDQAHNGMLDSASRKIDRVAGDVQLNALPDTSWDDEVADLKKLLKRAEDDLVNIAQAKTTTEAELQVSLGKLPGVEGQIKDVITALNEAEKAKARFIGSQKVLRESLLIVIDAKKDESIERLKTVLEQELEVRTYARATPNEPLNEGVVRIKIGDLVGIPSTVVQSGTPESLGQFLNRLKTLPALKDVTSKFRVSDPGLTSTLVGLGFDLARAEEQRLHVEIEEAKRRLRMLKDIENLLTAQKENSSLQLNPQGPGIARAANDLHLQGDETFRTTMDRLSIQLQRAYRESLRGPSPTTAPADFDRRVNDAAQARGTLHAVANAIFASFKARVIDQREIEALKTQIELAESHRSVRMAAVNLREREAVIGRGLQGLVAFHEGGIDKQDVTNLIGIAQTVGLFNIAAKVD
jgi:hypothetical protein